MSRIANTYRVALISDLHGNEIGLREVLRSIEARGVDEIVCLGDVATLGVAPAEVVDTLQRLGCRCIMGNHDDYLLQPGLVETYSDLPVIIEAVDWCRDQLSAEQLEFLRGFELGFDIPLGRERELKLFHGSPSSNMVDLLADTPADLLDEQLGSGRAVVMAGGHTHIQMLRQHAGSLLVNPGSVGAPFREYVNGGPPEVLAHAEYATIESRSGEISVGLHRVDLDRHALARAAQGSANPMRRELAAAYL